MRALRRCTPARPAALLPRGEADQPYDWRRRAPFDWSPCAVGHDRPDRRRAASASSAGGSCPRRSVPACARARGGLRRGVGRPRLPGRARRAAARLRRAAVAADRGPPPRPSELGLPGPPQAGGPQPHRLAQDQQRARARRCWPAAWARPGWSPRRAPASTAWPPPPRPRCSAWSASSTWARSTSPARSSTCSACGCWAPRCARSSRAAARSRTPSTRPCATGWPPSRPRHYCLGSVMGPHPYPWMVREFQRVIGEEARGAVRARSSTAACPTSWWRASAAGSNAAGIFAGFADTDAAAGRGRARRRGGHRPRRPRRRARHRSRTCCRTSAARCSRRTRSRPGSTTRASGPSTPTSHDIGRARYETVTDAEVLDAFQLLSRTEGIIPALEPAHALAWVVPGAGARCAGRPCC